MHDDDPRQTAAATAPSQLLSPGFLIAPPPLADPNFDRSVVLLTAHEEDGSMGFIINRQSDISLHALLVELDIQPTIADRFVLIGGPVGGAAGFVLYEHDDGRPLAPGIEVSRGLSITPAKDILERGAKGELPGRFDLILGYAGWGPGQLDDELERGGWLHAPFDAELLFDVPMASRWDETYARLGVSPLGFINVPGGAQA
jgi:putative transcriptional regulator